MVAANLRVPKRRIFGNVMYQLASTRNTADNPLALPSNSLDPDADWGPAAQDVRHRVFVMANAPLPYGLRVGLNSQYSSARPYNLTTGIDNNEDTVFNDRPAGVGRNSLRGASNWTVDLRRHQVDQPRWRGAARRPGGRADGRRRAAGQQRPGLRGAGARRDGRRPRRRWWR